MVRRIFSTKRDKTFPLFYQINTRGSRSVNLMFGLALIQIQLKSVVECHSNWTEMIYNSLFTPSSVLSQPANSPFPSPQSSLLLTTFYWTNLTNKESLICIFGSSLLVCFTRLQIIYYMYCLKTNYIYNICHYRLFQTLFVSFI